MLYYLPFMDATTQTPSEARIVPDSQYSIREMDLTAELGLPRLKVAQARQQLCDEGTEWRGSWQTDGKRGVWLTPEAANKLRTHFGTQSTVTVVEPEPFVVDAPALVEDVLVLVTRWKNDRLVRGRRKNGEEVRVRVRKGAREKVIPGMMIPCRKIEADLFECVRHPRYRGRM